MCSINAMKSKWLIEDFERDNSFGELADEVKRQGMECITIRNDDDISEKLKVWPGEQCVLFQGSISLAIRIQREKSWVPGPIADWKNFRCQTYYTHYGKWLLNSEYTMLPFAEFWRRQTEFHKRYGDFFLRPDDGVKTFTGFAVTEGMLDGNMGRYLNSECQPEDLVLVSPIKRIHREWRLICSKDEGVIASSRYKTWGLSDYNSDTPDEVLCYANEILRDSKWVPDSLFALDICDSLDGNKVQLEGLHLLEIGAFSVAGLYKCDLTRIVDVASRYAHKDWEETTQNQLDQ